MTKVDLQELLDMQRRLNKQLSEKRGFQTFSEVDPKTQQSITKQKIRDLSDAMSEEVQEFREESDYKWWTDSQDIDIANTKVEIVDQLHFLLSMALLFDMDAREMEDIYMQKNSENLRRQESGRDEIGDEYHTSR